MQISAFVDGELPENESELLLRRLSQDAELRKLVEEYMQIGRIMRRDVSPPNIGLLRARIAAALGEEPQAIPAVAAARGSRLLRPVAGLAVAASVALVGIFALQQVGDPQTTVAPQTADGTDYTRPASDQMLDEMFRHHGNSAIGTGSGGAIGEFVSFTDDIEFDDAELIQVAPKAELLSPVEIATDAEDDTSDEDAATPSDME